MADEMTVRPVSRPDPDPTLATIELVDKTLAAFKETVLARFDAIEKATQVFSDNLTRVPTALQSALEQARDFNDERFQHLKDHTDNHFMLVEKQFLASDNGREMVVAAINERISKTEAVAEQRFLRIDGGFQERDKRSDALAIAASTAIAAALSAQKEAAVETAKSSSLAIDKSERATIESLKSLQILFQTAIASQDARLQDLKGRMDRGEGSSSIADPATTLALTHLSEAVSRLTNGANQGAGAAQAKTDSTAWMFGVVAIIISVAAVVADAFLKK